MATLTLRTVAAGGLRPEFEHTRTRRRRAVMSPKDSASPRSRELNERGINVTDFTWKNASDGHKALLRWLWANALGTTLPMNFTPAGKTDAAMEDVYFVEAPKISRATPTTWAMSFQVEGRH